jgi:hypothetical protein
MFEKKMGSFLQPRSMLTDDEAAKLGIKNEEDEVEKFVQVSRRGWCSLSSFNSSYREH